MRPILTLFVAGAILAAPAAAEPRRFATPDDAVASFRAALDAGGTAGLLAVFGTEAEELLLTGEAERDRGNRRRLLRAWRGGARIEAEDGTATLLLGDDDWPFPIPLARQTDGQWIFDIEAGREAVLTRRIGANELDAIAALRAYVEVQAEYRRTDWDGDGVMEFAAHIISGDGARDGLFWPREPGVPRSPVGAAVARAAAEGFMLDGELQPPEPFRGYVFHILTAQGGAAPGGAFDYVIGGNMVAGHAAIAYPAAYGETGVMTFMVGENGRIWERDFGEATLDEAEAVDIFDPGAGWVPVE
jgi:hypothetical protein